ncbi:hypothetical protein LCGC14_0371010 [marine sediment metagenome]|uniref:Uncharacterized protein n=1 Tax=marine sediment metagenome TaxID=412755 RepID=A0A0F9T5D0_9ZZZZ
MKDLIKKIQADLDKHGSVSLHLGVVTERNLKKLRLKFNVERKYFGYYSFANK